MVLTPTSRRTGSSLKRRMNTWGMAKLRSKVCGLGLTGFTFQVTNSLVQALGNAQLQAYGTAAGMGDLYVTSRRTESSLKRRMNTWGMAKIRSHTARL